VTGFAYSPTRDSDVDPATNPVYGRPSCQEWWETGGVGLRDRMADHVGSFGQLRTKLTGLFTFASSDEIDDQLARMAVKKASPSYMDPERILGDERGSLDKLLHAPSDVLGALGAGWKGFEASATMMPLITLLTMAQPLILMGLYMFLPLVTVLSGYNLQVFVLGGLSIFTVKFWSVMWFIARWTDDHLIEAMYPDGNVLMAAVTLDLDGGYKRMILNILLMGMYVGLPLLWTGMMAWAGFRLGSGIKEMVQQASDTGRAAGAEGANMGKKIATKGR
jgi:hypothetical protein